MNLKFRIDEGIGACDFVLEQYKANIPEEFQKELAALSKPKVTKKRQLFKAVADYFYYKGRKDAFEYIKSHMTKWDDVNE